MIPVDDVIVQAVEAKDNEGLISDEFLAAASAQLRQVSRSLLGVWVAGVAGRVMYLVPALSRERRWGLHASLF